MKTWTKLGWMSVMSVSLFALAGCAKASAETAPVDDARTVTIEGAPAETQPTADADADNGPGCAESALDTFGQQ